jgi:hypothetical protein
MCIRDRLYLNGNQLTSFNGGDMTSLASLDFTNNGINSLVSFIGGNMTGLLSLNISNNQLTSFDGGNMISLTDLDLSNNQLESFDTGNMTSLVNVNLDGNPVSTTTTTTEEQTTTTTTTVDSSSYNVYDFTSTDSPDFAGQFGKYGVTDWDGTKRVVATDLNIGTPVYYIGTDGDKHLITFETSIVATNVSFIRINTSGSGITEIGGSITFDSISAFVATTTTTTTVEETTTTTTTEEQTTTTTTTENITNYSLTFRKLSYNGVEPKKAPLTVSEFEGNFGYLSDYVVHLLYNLQTLNNRVTSLEEDLSDLSDRITEIENNVTTTTTTVQ